MYFLQLPISGATSTFHKQGGYGEPKKNMRRDFLFGAEFVFGGVDCVVFLLMLGIFFTILDLVEKSIWMIQMGICMNMYEATRISNSHRSQDMFFFLTCSCCMA